MHWTAFVLATLLAAEENPDKMTLQMYDVIFDRSPGTSLQQASALVQTPKSEQAILRRLKDKPHLLAKVHKYDACIGCPTGQIEILRDSGKRRPSTFPGQDATATALLETMGILPS